MKKLLSLICCSIIIGSITVPALAVDNYRFETTNPEEFYQPGITTVTYDGAIPGYVQELYDFTPQTVHSSEYGTTVITPELNTGYGLSSEKPSNAPGSSSRTALSSESPAGDSSPASSSSANIAGVFSSSANHSVGSASVYGDEYNAQYALTPVEDIRKADGSIGTLKIPAIGLTVTAYDGEVTAAMKMGVGHIESTSSWNSNIGLVGHNRGSNDHFGKLKNLKAGDEIIYTTTLGTRTYEVSSVQKIASNDWSYLQYTTDNRITLLTCVEDQPEFRLCVQAVQKLG